MNVKKIRTLGLILILSFPMLYLPFSVNTADTDRVSNEFNPDDYIIVETFEYQNGTTETIMTHNGKISIEIVDPIENPTEVGLVSPISIADPGGSGGIDAKAECQLFDYYGAWVLISLVPLYCYYKFVFTVKCQPRGPAGLWTDNLREAKFRIKVSGSEIHYVYKEPGDFLWVKSYTLTMFRITPIPKDWAGRSYEGYCWAKDDDCCDTDLLDGESETGSDTCSGKIKPIPHHEVELEILGIGSGPIYDDETAGALFRITNHGDWFSEKFHISCPGLEKASVTYSHNDFWLDPDESTYFSITLDPTDIGTDDFQVRVTSDTYGTTDSVDCSIEILDDDDTPPDIQYTYTGDYTDGNPGTIIVTASDDSGLFTDPSGTYIVKPDLGTQDFSFFAKDNDTDRPGDRLSTTIHVPITILDDDIDPPIIGHTYTGDYTDGNPGEIIVTASDPSGLSVDPSGTYIVQPDLGTQDFYFDATDDDNDRPGEDDTTSADTLHVPITIVDDDETEPYFENTVITDDHQMINISFNGIDTQEGDDSGLSIIEIYVDGVLIHTYLPTPTEDTFYFSIANEWIFDRGVHDIRVTIVDADDDRPDDALDNEFSGTFEVSLGEMYDYVIWQIEELKTYVDENLEGILPWAIRFFLWLAQDALRDAYDAFMADEGVSGLVEDKFAQALTHITGFIIEIFNNWDMISDEHVEYIMPKLYSIRNNIVFLMGESVGVEQSTNIAQIEIELLNLNDFIDENIDDTDSFILRASIAGAIASLEGALFKIVLDLGTECMLTGAQVALDHSLSEVDNLLNSAKISQELADTLKYEIMQIQVEIELVKNSA
ncbi:MAG: hypothetical protein ACFFFT_18305 [Candidatus Thorarchaeota archaeon]